MVRVALTKLVDRISLSSLLFSLLFFLSSRQPIATLAAPAATERASALPPARMAEHISGQEYEYVSLSAGKLAMAQLFATEEMEADWVFCGEILATKLSRPIMASGTTCSRAHSPGLRYALGSSRLAICVADLILFRNTRLCTR